MASRTHSLEERLEPLTSQSSRAEDFKALCKPDYRAHNPALQKDLLYDVLHADVSPTLEEEVVLTVENERYIFTDWSRSQLRTHLGARPAWFKHVTNQVQAEELQRRAHVLDGRRIRLMRTYEGLGILRGFVSMDYAEIPDVDVMKALCNLLPEGKAIKGLSGISDKASYVYVVADHAPIGVGAKDRMKAYPGFVVRNSEVGCCSLWVIPFFYFESENDKFRAPVVLRNRAMLRKVHRGDQSELEGSLDEALKKLGELWAPLRTKMHALASKTFASEELAIEAMVDMLVRLKVRRGFTYDCCNRYAAAKHASHSGATILHAVLEACATTTLDTRYDQAETAGAVLLHLL
jgi:hypothetical protein